MSGWDFSVVLIVPAALQDDANLLSCALGHDELPGGTYRSPLGSTSDKATHYGCHTWAEADFVSVLSSASGGQLPPIPWADYGLTEAKVGAVVAGLKSSVKTGVDPGSHWLDAIAAEGLVPVVGVKLDD